MRNIFKKIINPAGTSKKVGVASLVLALALSLGVGRAQADTWSLTGSNSLQGTVSVAMPVTDLQVSTNGTSSIPVKLRVTNGSLQMATTTGLTFTGASTGSTLYFTGSPSNINAALASLIYTRGSTGTDTLEVSLVNYGEVFFSDNNHLYEYISYTADWTTAKAQAELQNKYGSSGYLVTVGSQAENDFVAARLLNAGWMGASDAAVEGAWRWVTGPETGTQFWSGAVGGSTVGGNYANWGTGEPNDSGSNEDCAQFLTGGTGKWNDLPCTGTTLPGYVVEYGGTSTVPTVTAKNIAITTSSLPTVNTLSPADNATVIGTSTNLVIQFSQTVTAGAGSVILRKTSDNSVIETIAAASTTRVTGTGTNTITINPTTDFSESTGYYVTIDSNAFQNSSNAYYAGISASSTWNFTTGDFTAPLITSLVAASTSSTTAGMTWTTNELASTIAYYDTDPTRLRGATALADVSPRVLSHSVSLSDLLPCTSYTYRAVSSDASSNVATSSAATFKTSGCVGSAPFSNSTSTPVNPASNGTSTLSTASTTLSVITSPNFADASSTVAIQISSASTTEVISQVGSPGNSYTYIGSNVFDVKAIINNTTVLDSFDTPVTITYQYEDADVLGMDESTLWLYHFHNGAWARLDNCTVDTSINLISCTTDGFSIFALFGLPTAAASGVTHAPGSITAFATTQFGCKDPSAANYSAFASSKPEMCVYKKSNGNSNGNSAAMNKVASAAASAPTSVVSFLRNLTIGSSGDDVKRLQQILNSNGFAVAASGPGSFGNETNLFGKMTKNALAKYQKANGITPAIGYFGPTTRAFVNSHQ